MSYRTNLLDWYRQVGIYASRGWRGSFVPLAEVEALTGP
jgi:hypothetical protein